MALPLQFAHLGATGAIQNPGDLGSLGQAMQGLPQILQANQQLQMERERQAMNQQYQQAQMDHLKAIEAGQAASAAEEARQNAAVGSFIQQISTPQTGATVVNPSLAGMAPMVLPIPGGAPPMGVEEALGGMNPRDVPAALEKGKDQIKARREQDTQARTTRAEQTLAKGRADFLSSDQTPQSVQAILKTIDPSKQKDFVAELKELRTPDGTWTKVDSGPERKILFINPVTKQQWDTGQVAPPPAPGASVSINMPGEFERRNSALYSGAVKALTEVKALRDAGYNPLNESALSKLAGTTGFDKTRYAALSSDGKLYYNGVRYAISNALYGISGAAQGDKEVERRINLFVDGFFGDPATLEQKERFLVDEVQTLGQMGGRGVEGKNPLPASWDDFMGIKNKDKKQAAADTAKFGSEFDRLHKPSPRGRP